MSTKTRSVWFRAIAASLIGPVAWLPVAAYAASEDVAVTEVASEDEANVPAAPAADIDGVDKLIDESIEGREVTYPNGHPEREVTYAVPLGGGDKSAATPQAISLPKAEGSIQGMGESFSPVLSSGTGTFSVPIAMPPGRAGVAPSLALSYSSAGGSSEVGFGWSLGIPFIARQTDRGLPRYVDAATWQVQEDRFIYNGGQELVPVNSGAAELVDCGSAGCAPIPAELTGWQQYRAQIEGGYQRFFRSPNRLRWVVHAKDGTRFDFGQLPAADGPDEMVLASSAALQSELPGGGGRTFKWFLTRVTDPHGSTIYYGYLEDQGSRYLQDIHYLTPHSSCSSLSSATDRMRCTAPLADYGRRVHLAYEARADIIDSFTTGWEVRLAKRLRRIEITAAMGAPGARTLARRYHLTYDPTSFHSLLSSIQLEGRSSTTDGITGAVIGQTGIAEASLGATIVGDTLPPMTFTYTKQPTTSTTVAGFGGIDATVREAGVSPPHSVDEARADLFDVNSDGLPDLIVTNPAVYTTPSGAPGVGVFFNGFGEPGANPSATAGTFSGAVVMPVPPSLSGVMTLSNLNVAPMDIDGDGRSDLLHMPRVASYRYFTPARTVAPSPSESVSPADQGWTWAYVPATLPGGFIDPGIDFTADGTHFKQLDVNNDNLIDVVQTTGTSIKTWFNLGWLPTGDGRFGSFSFNATTGTYSLSPTPVTRCLPHAGTPVEFGDDQIKIGDVNGDGLQDIVRLQAGSFVYWPGRGDGSWGVGTAPCAPGFAADREIEVATPPAEINPELDAVYLSDVNGDGADDVVQVRFHAIDVWFNKAGQAFTGRVIATGVPHAPAYANRVRVTDIDGSGTKDVLYARADNWDWVDLMGGQKPRLLETVAGNLGAVTSLEYGSSTDDYLADLQAAADCVASDCTRFTWTRLDGTCDQKLLNATGACLYRTGGSPVISAVVRSVSTSDRFHLVGGEENVVVNAYAYHDGYFEGIEHEFRGFGAADVEAIGDLNHPTSYTRTYFHQGRRPASLASDRLADNPDEALKGQTYLTEVSDTFDQWLSTAHRTVTIRNLHTGLDGRMIRDAVDTRADQLVYDVTNFVYSGDPLSVPRVIRPSGTESADLVIRGEGWAHIKSTVDEIDNIGNVERATKHGRMRGEFGETLPDESIVSYAVFQNVADSATRWLWRTSDSHVDGQGDPTDLAATTNEFNDGGDLTSSTVDVQQATLYNFGTTLGSPSPEDVVVTTAFDSWGNPTAFCAGGQVATGVGCLRHVATEYDTHYAVFPLSEAKAVRRATSGFEALETAAIWDTGLGLLLSVADPNEEVSSVTYDGFGRLTSLITPPVVGCSAGMPSTRITYFATASPATFPVSRVVSATFTSCTSTTELIEAYAYVDGLGRTRAVVSTGDGTSGEEWIKAGVTTFDARGTVSGAYDPIYHSASPAVTSSAVALPPTGAVRTVYDAFGRVVLVLAQNGDIVEYIEYFTLTKNIYDALDLDDESEHVGTPKTERVDGHGRVIEQILRNRQPGASEPESYRLWTEYRADGAVVRLKRAETTTDDGPKSTATIVSSHSVERTFTYDTISRRVGTTDPNTDNPTTGATWRYLFNRVGDLAAVRDPRGCGQDFFYDHAGRLIGEAYVSCSEAQPHETPTEEVPSGAVHWTETTATRPADVYHAYDSYADAWEPTPSIFADYPSSTAGGLLGRLAATSDRAVRSVLAYDSRGNPIWEARQIAVIPDAGAVAASLSDPLPATPAAPTPAPSGPVVYDEVHTYVITRAFDHANRATGLVLPKDPDFDSGPAPYMAGRLAFGTSGRPCSATANIVGGGAPVVGDGEVSWGSGTIENHPIVTEIRYEADGQVRRATYGDDRGATRDPTVSQVTYDNRRRPDRMWTIREATELAVPPDRPLGAVILPFDQSLEWDESSNLTKITDNRYPFEWPPGHRPQSIAAEHDSLYRVTNAAFSYRQDDESWTTFDDATDWRDEQARVSPHDPMRPEAAPILPPLPDDRVADLTWQYDWLGNMTVWEDDAHAFYERSIGTITNGADVSLRPSALYLASDLSGPPSNRGGYVEVSYGSDGDLIGMTVRAQCVDVSPATCADPGGSNLAARRSTLAATCLCASEQHYQYLWDEVNRLSEARRYDRGSGSGPWSLQVRQRYRYDGANQRSVKHTIDPFPASGDPTDRIALFVLSGTFERRGLVLGTSSYQGSTALSTESQYLLAGARLVWRSGTPSAGIDAGHRITVTLVDLLGTTSGVIDIRTGEFIEARQYYPNGSPEALLSVTSTSIPLEPTAFTAKEEDDAVALVHFGARYLVPRIGRWLSPDPLETHFVGAGLPVNSFHYVAGKTLQARDAIGLEHNVQGPTPTSYELRANQERREMTWDEKFFSSEERGRSEARRCFESWSEADRLNSRIQDSSGEDFAPIAYWRLSAHIGTTQNLLDSNYIYASPVDGYVSYAVPQIGNTDRVSWFFFYEELSYQYEIAANNAKIEMAVAAASALAGNMLANRPRSRTVYRGLAAGEDPSAGLQARSPGLGNTEVSHISGAKKTQWISTTKSLEVAKRKYGANGVVAIDLDKLGPGSEVSDVSAGPPGAKQGSRAYNYARRDQEVLIKDYIPAEAISPVP